LWLNTDPDPIRIHGFYDQKLKKFTAEKNFIYFFDNKMRFTYPWTFIMDVQAAGEAFSPQKKTSSTSKHEISSFFKIFVGNF
jgi:hypothetical protein